MRAGAEEMSKKNLNSMFAFVSAFLVVASSRIVATINEAVANMTVLLLLGVCFMLLVGVFHTGDDKKSPPMKNIFQIIMFVGIIAIFLHAIKTRDGTPWLYYAWGWIVSNLDTGVVGAILLTVIMIVLIGFVTGNEGGLFSKNSGESGGNGDKPH